MNLNEAAGFATGMKTGGWNNIDIAERLIQEHRLGGFVQSEDRTMTVFYFPEGIMLLTPYGEVQAYRGDPEGKDIITTDTIITNEIVDGSER